MILRTGHGRGLSYDRWISRTASEDAFWLLRTHWKRVVLGSLLGLCLAAAYNRWSPEEYVSHATVRFIPPQVAESYVASNVAMQVEQRIFAISQLVNSRLTATQMIEGFGLYPQKRRFYPVADIVPEFQKALKLTTVSSQGETKAVPSIVISFRYSDPDRAQKVVQRIVELIYEENRRYRSDQSIGTTDFLQQEVKSVTEQIKGLEQKLAELPTPGGEDKEYRNILRVEHLHDLERRVTEIQHDMSFVLVDRNLRKTQVESLDAQMKARTEQGGAKTIQGSSSAQQWIYQITQASAKYEELRARYKANNPEVVAAERALNVAKEELAKQQQKDREVDLNQDLSAISSQLSRAKAELAGYDATLQKESREEADLNTEIAALRSQFSSTPSVEDRRLQLMREYDGAKAHYAQLIKKQSDSQMASDMERRGHGETAELVEPPTFPLRAEFPTQPAVLSSGWGVGALAAYALALLGFLRAPRVRLAAHLDVLGPYPVLACLPGSQPLLLKGTNVLRGSSGNFTRSQTLLTSLVVLTAVLAGCSASLESRRNAEFQAGKRAIAVSDYRNAEIRFRRAIQIDKKFGDAYLELADVYSAEAQPMQAYEQLVRAGELLPDRPEVVERLADSTYQLYFADPGRPAALLREVEQRANKLMERWPSRPSGYRLGGQVLIERHRGAEAIALMENGLTHVEDGSLRTQLAAAYFQDGDRAKAEEHLRESITRNPKFSPGFDLLYLQLMERGEPTKGRAVLEAKVQAQGGVEASMQLAAHDEASGARRLAEDRLNAISTESPADPLVHAKIGDFWLHRGEFAKASEWYESGMSRFPSQHGLYAGRKAELLMAQKNSEGAKELVNRELAAHPDDALMRAYQAAFGLDTPGVDRHKAQADLESVLTQMPNSPFVKLHLGRAYLLNGDLLRAGQQLRSAVTLDPNYAPGWLALAEYELASGDTSQAQQQLAALLRRSPGYLPARLLDAQASLALHKPAEAEKTLGALLEADPQNVEVMMSLARAKVSTGQLLEGEKLLLRARGEAPQDPRPWLLLTRLDVDQGHSKHALELLQSIPSPLSENPEIASMTASVALLAAQNQTARTKYETLLKKDPENLQYRLGYATSLAVLGQTDQAKEQFQAVQSKAGNSPEPWLLYGVMMSSAGNAPAATEAYKEVLKRDAKNPFAMNNLAFLLARDGQDLQKALELAEAARRILPRSGEVHDTLAYIYVRLGMKRNAAAALEELAVTQPASLQQHTKALLDQINRGDLAAVRVEMEQNSAGLN